MIGIEQQLARLVERVVRKVVREEFDRRETGAPVADGWLSIQNAADLADVHRSTVRRWIASGDLPVARHGALARIKRSDLETLLGKSDDDDDDFDSMAHARKLLGR